MKYIFGIDRTEKKENQFMDGQIFHSNGLSESVKMELIKRKNIAVIVKRYEIVSITMYIIKGISMLGAATILIFLLEGIVEGGLKKVYSTFPILFHTMIVLFFIAMIFHIIESVTKKKNSKKNKSDIRYLYNLSKELEGHINILYDAKVIEFVTFSYKNKNGKTKICKKGIEKAIYKQFYVYVKNNSLYLCDIWDEWSIPIRCIQGIVKLKKNYYAISIQWYAQEYELIIPFLELSKIELLIKEAQSFSM